MAFAKRVWTTEAGETRRAFVAKARDLEVRLELRRSVHEPAGLTVREAAALWLARARAEDLEDSTITKYEQLYRIHIDPVTAPANDPNRWAGRFGDVKLSQLTTPLCDLFRLQLLTAKKRNQDGKIDPDKLISRRTARTVLVAFKGILNEAQRRGQIHHNPALPIRIGAKARDQVPIRIGDQIPDRCDVRAILAASTGLWHVLFSTAAFTGMRSSELRALTWKNVDLDKGVLRVTQRADVKGAIGKCKTRSGYRIIQIGDDLADELRCWKLTARSTSSMGLVFANEHGGVLSKSAMLDRLLRMQRRMGMRRPNGRGKYHVHSLRHFYASIMIAAGTQPKRLQELLGHATLAMTMDTYGHLFPAGSDEISRINRAMELVGAG